MVYATDPEGAMFSAFQDTNLDYQPEIPRACSRVDRWRGMN